MRPVESPCIDVCVLDPRTRFCRGCGRSNAEIAGWQRMSARERREIEKHLAARLRAMEVQD